MTQQNSVLVFSVRDTSRLLILICVQSSFTKTKFYNNRGLFCPHNTTQHNTTPLIRLVPREKIRSQSSKRQLHLKNNELPRKLPSPCRGSLFDKYISFKLTQNKELRKEQGHIYKKDNRQTEVKFTCAISLTDFFCPV